MSQVLSDFIKALRETRAFRDVYPKSETANDDGMLGASVLATYAPVSSGPAQVVEAAAPASTPAPAAPPRAASPQNGGLGGRRP